MLYSDDWCFYRRFGITYPSHLLGLLGEDRLPQNAGNYQSALCNISESEALLVCSYISKPVPDDGFLKNNRNTHNILDNKRYCLKYDRVWCSPLFIFNNKVSRIQFRSFGHDAYHLSDMTVIRSRVRHFVQRLPCLQSSSWGQLMIHIM